MNEFIEYASLVIAFFILLFGVVKFIERVAEKI